MRLPIRNPPPLQLPPISVVAASLPSSPASLPPSRNPVLSPRLRPTAFFAMFAKAVRRPSLLRQALLALIPAVLWFYIFSSGVSIIPPESRPPINVTLLPTIDRLFFANSVNWFPSQPPRPALDLLAAVPYTLHASLPFVYIAGAICSPVLRAALPRFIVSFGTMNLAAVITHLSFPTAPPWYNLKYGSTPANYSMKGEPAVLARVDDRYNISLYHSMYGDVGKVVFGAFPSLHAAWPYLITRFQPALSAPLRLFACVWVLVVWWAAIYLHHHFAVDVVGGIIYAELAMALGYFIFPTSYHRVKTLSDSDSDTSLPVVMPHTK